MSFPHTVYSVRDLTRTRLGKDNRQSNDTITEIRGKIRIDRCVIALTELAVEMMQVTPGRVDSSSAQGIDLGQPILEYTVFAMSDVPEFRERDVLRKVL